MSTLELHDEVTADEPESVLARLEEFYVANGYDYGPETGSDDTTLLVRGKSGSGWWSSNMTELASEVRLVTRANTVEIHYDVDISGQYLTDEDRTFWDNEIAKAATFGRGELQKPPDLREAEEQRAEKGFGGRLYVGVWGAFLVAVVILLLGFFGVI
jgi:hypothetical protein